MKKIMAAIECVVEYWWIFVGILCVISLIAFISINATCAEEHGILVKRVFPNQGYVCIEKGLH